MGELVAGRPIVQLQHRISLPLDLLSYMALLYRAVPGSGLSPELIAARRSLDYDLRTDLDLLHGFSGRLLHYMEEPVLRLDPLGSGANLTCESMTEALLNFPAEDYQEMAIHAIGRVHEAAGTQVTPPSFDDVDAWREYILPALTTASPEETFEVIANPVELKRRTVSLFSRICQSGYTQEFAGHRHVLEQALAVAGKTSNLGFGLAFSELTGNRLPSTLVSRMADLERVIFCPTMYLGVFVSYIVSPPDVIVYYSAPEYLKRVQPQYTANGRLQDHISDTSPLDEDSLLDALKALSDVNRLRIVELLASGELYAQEVVGRLGIAQSAVSRHLSLLERAGLITVTPRRGMKYYSLNEAKMDEVAASLLCRCSC
ncbi:MAG: metalloregulator ArsR/SmtB family transcription factor [Thermomicrobiales bacterium]